MTSSNLRNCNEGMTLRQAALVAGFAYLLNPVSYAQFTLYPRLVIPGNIDQTVQNIGAHSGLYVAVIFCYLINFIGDIVIAWSLYFLLAPVNKALSLLASLFQLIYTAVALAGWLNLVTAFHLVKTPDYLAAFGPGPLHAQVLLLLHTFQADWSMSLLLFGIHLVLVGILIVRSRYIPWLIGILLIVNGLGWVTDTLSTYVFPDAHLGFLMITFFGELVFMLWLLIRGWKIKEPLACQDPAAANSGA